MPRPNVHKGSERVRELNDAFRRTLRGGRVVLTNRVAALSREQIDEVIRRVQAFDGFDEANDPYGEHDFGALEFGGRTFFFKIDYYDPTFRFGSSDPADAAVTARVLTILFADEY